MSDDCPNCAELRTKLHAAWAFIDSLPGHMDELDNVAIPQLSRIYRAALRIDAKAAAIAAKE